MKKGCIVVAGGKGLRMGGEIPKQYLEIGGKPILVRTVDALRAYDGDMFIVVAVPESDLTFVRELLSIGQEEHHISIVAGGETRTESVLNALSAMPRDIDRIGVHDGVRPFVDEQLLSRLFGDKAAVVIPIVPCTDSVRLNIEGTYVPVDRSEVALVQTPQVFDASVLRMAYDEYIDRGGTTTFTDDASLVGALLEIPPSVVPGSEYNIKITTPKDMILGEWIASKAD
ncbi:2-C-methyl-D-erythritol 4-phosphate cytidylyltransferase [Porphyromonas sp.]|uniref:IspD/TarI family cytidylyltransferase n=1 Tax=Porphyromonas sp. TaxID=1924944 RepID=UPI0026DB576D|nr:IspD/TarI family cytidylyltransferase [Porphyromonas sp.]MDO4770864.1 IspD/TarI family cytidylyltransferase [Porphyromonas sp.]